MKKQSLEEQFEEKFRNYRLQPNAQVWQTIETELQKSQASHRKALPIWWAAAASGALLLSAYGGYQYYKNTEGDSGQNVATVHSDKNGQAQNIAPQIRSENDSTIAVSKIVLPNKSLPQPENQNTRYNKESKKREIEKNEQPMQYVFLQNEVVLQKKEQIIDVKNTTPMVSTVPKTVLAEVKTLPNPLVQTMNTLPNNNQNTSLAVPNPTVPQPPTIAYEPTIKQPIFSAWRELNESSPQDSTTSERLLQLAESKAKRLVKRVDIAGIWSDFKTLRGR